MSKVTFNKLPNAEDELASQLEEALAAMQSVQRDNETELAPAEDDEVKDLSGIEFRHRMGYEGVRGEWIDGPKPYMKDGAPVSVGALRDGRPIYIADRGDGGPMIDRRGEFVVIDPQTGRLREKTARRSHAQALPPMENEDLHKLASACIEAHDPSFLAFVGAVVPPSPRVLIKVDPLRNRVIRFLVSRAMFALAFFVRLATKVRYKLQRPWFGKRRKFEFSLNIEKLPGVEEFLTPEALDLVNKQHKSTILEKDGKIYSAHYAVIRTPLEPDGSVSQIYVKRWANFLNDMAARGIWVGGVLAQPSLIKLAQAGLRWEKGLFTFLFTDISRTAESLNEEIGCNVFQEEGGYPASSSEWKTFKW